MMIHYDFPFTLVLRMEVTFVMAVAIKVPDTVPSFKVSSPTTVVPTYHVTACWTEVSDEVTSQVNLMSVFCVTPSRLNMAFPGAVGSVLHI